MKVPLIAACAPPSNSGLFQQAGERAYVLLACATLLLLRAACCPAGNGRPVHEAPKKGGAGGGTVWGSWKDDVREIE